MIFHYKPSILGYPHSRKPIYIIYIYKYYIYTSYIYIYIYIIYIYICHTYIHIYIYHIYICHTYIYISYIYIYYIIYISYIYYIYIIYIYIIHIYISHIYIYYTRVWTFSETYASLWRGPQCGDYQCLGEVDVSSVAVLPRYVSILYIVFSMGIPGSQNGGTVPYKGIFCGDIPLHRPLIF